MSEGHRNHTEDYTGSYVLSKNCISVCTSFSLIVLKTDMRDIGLKLETVTEQPFLNNGMTIACFILSGNAPERKESFMMWGSGEEIY